MSVFDEKYLPTPRSPSLTQLVGATDVMKTFAGLMSRCITRRSCMYLRASAICVKLRSTAASVRATPVSAASRMSPARSPCSASSITTVSSLRSITQSRYMMMCGCVIDWSSLISFMHSVRSLVPISKTCTFFNAHTELFSSRRALYTTENLPEPIRRWIS